MIIEHKSAVLFHYTLCDEEGIQLSKSGENNPSACLLGYNNVVTGLESALLGKQEGDQFSVTLQPEDAHGLREDTPLKRISLKHLVGKKKWKPGMHVLVNTNQVQQPATLIKVGKFTADIDTNHPLAGKIMNYEIHIITVRKASSIELQHGHVHGIDEHDH